MTRARLDYSDRRDVRAAGFDPDQPIAGYYRFRMRSGGAFCGVRIWHGQPLDPETGEELDRSLRWNALLADEYKHFCRVQTWAREKAPDSAFADPRRKIDLLSTSNPLPF